MSAEWEPLTGPAGTEGSHPVQVRAAPRPGELCRAAAPGHSEQLPVGDRGTPTPPPTKTTPAPALPGEPAGRRTPLPAAGTGAGGWPEPGASATS